MDPGQSKKEAAKEIEVLETEWYSAIYSDDDRVVRKYYQIFCAFAANLLMFCYGLIMPASGFLLPQLERTDIGFGITKEEGSWLASIMVLGSLTGSLGGGWQCGKFGRKKSMLIDSVLFLIGTLMLALGPHFYVTLAARLLQGHSSASSMVAVPIYTSETSQPQIRKITGSFASISFTSGFAFALILGAVFPWRWAVGLVVICPVCSFVMLLFCPETPVWYVSKGREDEAKLSLSKLRGEQNSDIVQAEFNRISLNCKIMEKEREIHGADVKESVFQEIKSLATDPTFLKPFGFLLVIWCIGFEWSGFPAIAFYMVPLLKSAEIPMDPYWAAAMLASTRALMTLIAPVITKRAKRKPVYLACNGCVCVGTFSLACYCYFNQNGLLTSSFPIARWIPILSILCCYVGYAFGMGSIPFMLQGELLPVHARSVGSALLGIIDNLSLFLSAKLVPTFNEYLGVHGSFLMYCFLGGCNALFSFFTMPETSGMSLEEIEDMYRPKKKIQK